MAQSASDVRLRSIFSRTTYLTETDDSGKLQDHTDF
jgi:hypothetical protein